MLLQSSQFSPFAPSTQHSPFPQAISATPAKKKLKQNNTLEPCLTDLCNVRSREQTSASGHLVRHFLGEQHP